MTGWAEQPRSGVRFDWGLAGATRLSGAAVVVVDVLSFTTAVTVAVEADTRVYPYRWRDASAAGFAAQVGAELAVGRSQVTESTPWSLSPAALRAAPPTPALVLPSPNGSTITAAVRAPMVAAGCVRNARAVGRSLAARGYGTAERPVLVIAAGEHWPDGAFRPALEDYLGAGLVVAALGDADLSPEAAAARACATGTDVAAAIAGCASGRELVDAGFGEDVAVATEIGSTDVVPVLTGEPAGFGPLGPACPRS